MESKRIARISLVLNTISLLLLLLVASYVFATNSHEQAALANYEASRTAQAEIQATKDKEEFETKIPILETEMAPTVAAIRATQRAQATNGPTPCHFQCR